jgi:hypothetical protein
VRSLISEAGTSLQLLDCGAWGYLRAIPQGKLMFGGIYIRSSCRMNVVDPDLWLHPDKWAFVLNCAGRCKRCAKKRFAVHARRRLKR